MRGSLSGYIKKWSSNTELIGIICLKKVVSESSCQRKEKDRHVLQTKKGLGRVSRASRN